MFIFSNLAISLDGKISTSDRSVSTLGSSIDRSHMMELRLDCDAILNGADTLRTFKRPLEVPDTEEQPHNVIISSKLKNISPNWAFFSRPNIRRIFIVGPDATSRSIKPFEKFSEIFKLKKPTAKNPVARQVIQILKDCGIERLLIEGGGSIMWEFASKNLIDEYHVTLTPKIIGGKTSPTLVDGGGFKAKDILGLKLTQCQIKGDELYLVYRSITGAQPGHGAAIS